MSEAEIYSVAEAALTKYMKLHRMRKTPERFAILRKVTQMKSHFNIDRLYEALEKDEGYHVARSTLYATVELLCEAGILRRHQFGALPTQYEVALGNHFHLICKRCGKVKEVKDDPFMRQMAAKRYSAFQTEHFSVYVYGTCFACLRREAKERREEARQRGNIPGRK